MLTLSNHNKIGRYTLRNWVQQFTHRDGHAYARGVGDRARVDEPPTYYRLILNPGRLDRRRNERSRRNRYEGTRPANHAVTTAQPEAFDHDAYVRARLPNFVLVGMGLGQRNQRPLPPSPDAARPAVPARVQRRLTPPQTSAQPATRSTPPSDASEPPEEEPAPATRRRRTRDESLDRRARQTITAVLAIPVWFIVIALFFGLLTGPPDGTVVVNDERGCEAGPLTVARSELGTRRYWEEC